MVYRKGNSVSREMTKRKKRIEKLDFAVMCSLSSTETEVFRAWYILNVCIYNCDVVKE